MKIKLEKEPQKVDYDLFSEFAPNVSMEIDSGYLLFSQEEREKLFLLLAYNLGTTRISELLTENSGTGDLTELDT